MTFKLIKRKTKEQVFYVVGSDGKTINDICLLTGRCRETVTKWLLVLEAEGRIEHRIYGNVNVWNEVK